MRHILQHRTRIAAVVSVFIAVGSLKAQVPVSVGTDFYLCHFEATFNTVIPAFSSGFYRVYALVSSYQDNTVYVSYFDSTGIEQSVTPYKVQARKTVQVPLAVPLITMRSDSTDKRQYLAVHIRSVRPISVAYFSTGGCSGGSYLVLPTVALGRKYVVGSYNDNPDGEGAMLGGRGPSTIDRACGTFIVIGVQDSTVVTITPTTTTQQERHQGVWYGPGATGTPVPYKIRLNRGQVYQVKSWCADNSSDITGSLVESNKPVSVIAGHENASLGGVSNRSLEARDYMIEQMLPVEYWDSKGYVSIPFVDSSPLNPGDEGTGDNYRVLTFDPNGAEINLQRGDAAGDIEMNIGRFNTREVYGVEAAVNFYSPTGKKFLPYQIDQCNQSTKEPFPRPSMMQLMPKSLWRNSFLWFVPSNVDERFQAYYVNVIGPKGPRNNLLDSIYVSINGDKEGFINTKLSSRGSFSSIPGHPELTGVRYKVTPGSYYARAHFPFMIYQYGNRAIDSDGDLGDFDNDDNFFSYALPLGIGMELTDTMNVTLRTDTLCGTINVCMTAVDPNVGIRTVIRLDDPFNDLLYPPRARNYKYDNCRLDPDLDPNNTGTITFETVKRTQCFRLMSESLSRGGYAPLLVIDENNRSTIVELTVPSADILSSIPTQEIDYQLQKIGDVQDTTFIFVSSPTSPRTYTVESIRLLKNIGAFTITLVKPTTLPAEIRRGDTLIFRVRSVANEPKLLRDTIEFISDCIQLRTPLAIQGALGHITADDHTFRTTSIGGEDCYDSLTIHNLGTLPFTLSDTMIIGDTKHFRINGITTPAGAALPYAIPPGGKILLRVCYTPTSENNDSTAVVWRSDLPPKFAASMKQFSVLRGKGILDAVVWERQEVLMPMDSDRWMVTDVTLRNLTNGETTIQNVWFEGGDADEFRFVDFQKTTPAGYSMTKGESVWYRVGILPDMTKPVPIRDRVTKLILQSTRNSDTMTIRATFGLTASVIDDEGIGISIYPNPASRTVQIEFSAADGEPLEILLVDQLGRTLKSMPRQYFSSGAHRLRLDVSDMPSGMYWFTFRTSKTTTLKNLLIAR